MDQEIDEALDSFRRAVELQLELTHGEPSAEPRTIPLQTHATSRREAEQQMARFIDDFAKRGIQATLHYVGESEDNIHDVELEVKGRLGE